MLQTQRIAEKLELARKADKGMKAFGAKYHRYELAPPLSTRRLEDLEDQYQAKLPNDIRSFLTHVGDGKYSPDKPFEGGAGPFLGLHNAEQILRSIHPSEDPLLTSHMSDGQWHTIQRRIDDEELEFQEQHRGCAFLTSQGSSYWSLVVLAGPDKGRIVYYDESGNKPYFVHETGFLDWYERWLDEVALGYLTRDRSYWFGTVRGGDDKSLLDAFDASTDASTRLDCLFGLSKLVDLTDLSVARLASISMHETGKLRESAVIALIQFRPEASLPFLSMLIEDSGTNIPRVCWVIRQQKRPLIRYVESSLEKRLASNPTHDEFSAIVFLLRQQSPNVTKLVRPFVNHIDPKIRQTAVWALEDQ